MERLEPTNGVAGHGLEAHDKDAMNQEFHVLRIAALVLTAIWIPVMLWLLVRNQVDRYSVGALIAWMGSFLVGGGAYFVDNDWPFLISQLILLVCAAALAWKRWAQVAAERQDESLPRPSD